MTRSQLAVLGVAFVALVLGVPAGAQERKTWQGSCMCERFDEDDVLHLVILVTDANRAEIAKRLAAGEADNNASVMFVSNMCVDPKLCTGPRPMVVAGNKVVSITNRRVDGDKPYDASLMSTAKTLTITGKGK
jgi:hypothetical protein